MKFPVTAVTVVAAAIGVIALMGCTGFGPRALPEPDPSTREEPVPDGQAVNQPQDAGNGAGEPNRPGGSGAGAGAGGEGGGSGAGAGAGGGGDGSGGSPPPDTDTGPQPPAVPPPEATPVPGAPPPVSQPAATDPEETPPPTQPAATDPEETPPPTQPQESAERSCNDPIPEWLCGAWEWGGTTPAIRWTFAVDEIFGAVNGAGVKGSITSSGTVRAGPSAGQPYVNVLVIDAQGEGEFYRFNQEPNPDRVGIYIQWMGASYLLRRVVR